jgi:hypothetical protein
MLEMMTRRDESLTDPFGQVGQRDHARTYAVSLLREFHAPKEAVRALASSTRARLARVRKPIKLVSQPARTGGQFKRIRLADRPSSFTS